VADKQVQQLDHVIIRFAGDSGDGMQLTGDRFTQETAIFGNDLSTLPNFPAEIRAPAGTLPGVSSFQLHYADHHILTPGDEPDVLVAMNPAALKANLADLPRGGDLIVNTDEFTKRNLARVGYDASPLEDGSLEQFNVHAVPLTSLTVKALESFDITRRDAERAKNMFALGLLSWLYDRPAEGTLAFLKARFGNRPEIMNANVAAFQAGWNFGETAEMFPSRYQVKPARLTPGTYRNINGSTALSYGLIAASQLAGLPLFFGSYPITPASEILHELARHKRFGVRTFQAEDEIAACGAALGSSFGGSLGVTATSGPGMLLKAETIGLAMSVELPLIICDIQRAGPSTGMPTKTEQGDLLQAMFGRNGESPVPIVAAAGPADCFHAAIEAARIALKYRTPVFLLSDTYLANGSEPWRIPDVASLPDLTQEFAFADPADLGSNGFEPFRRDPATLARPWAIPGTAGLEHRIGGIEKDDITGDISYDPANHDRMVRLRQAKVDGIAADIPPVEVDDPDGTARVLVLGWGSTAGTIGAAVRRIRGGGQAVAQAHLRHLNPFPSNLGDVLRRYDRVLVPEINLGQLTLLLRARYLVDVISYNRVSGMPFQIAELAGVIEDVISHA
jgi:2-oxoglutarate/2-oxoacid ferredoxin oxidoreductase subunit alpha